MKNEPKNNKPGTVRSDEEAKSGRGDTGTEGLDRGLDQEACGEVK